MLEIRNLHKRFGQTTAVGGVSLSLSRGEMVAVIGSSGAGKSTLLRLVNRLIDPCSGSIHCEGDDITALRGRALSTWRCRCAMVFQQFNLIGRLDVLTNVLLARVPSTPLVPALFKRFAFEDRVRAIEALDRFELADKALERAANLSGGQQQRVAIARALVQEAEIVLADEPIASLDPRNSDIVMQSLRHLRDAHGITVICNLHQIAVARRYCDRIIALSHGRVMFDGPVADLTPDHEATIFAGAPADALVH
jgi:phosphonate transport system ATP-binding protein